MKNKGIFLVAMIFMSARDCGCQHEPVSFNTLFPPSSYKQELNVYIGIWNQLRSADLPAADRLMLEATIIIYLMRINERILMRRMLSGNADYLSHKDVYLLALLVRICRDQH